MYLIKLKLQLVYEKILLLLTIEPAKENVGQICLKPVDKTCLMYSLRG